MSKRKIRRLYAAANSAWREGVLASEHQEHPREPGGKFARAALPAAPTVPGFDYAVWTAMRLGFEHGERMFEMTPEAWSVVLAEAQRP